MEVDDLDVAWDRALEHYRDIDAPAARFNVELLLALRPRWGGAVRPDTSMFDVLFTPPGTTGYNFDERVEVAMESADRVRLAFVRQVPRRGERNPAGPVTIAGDFVRPETAPTAVEALLLQLADPDVS